jgi:hypothetical protein
MLNLLAQLRRIGWAAVEAAFLVIVLSVLLDIIVGGPADSFIATVTNNTERFLQSLPPGVVLGVVLIAAIYGLLRSRLKG